MNSFCIRKVSDSFAWFDDGQRLYAGSTYRVVVEAEEFREDLGSAARLGLAAGGVVLAGCELQPDPLRRGLRVGELTIPAYRETSGLELRVTLAGCTVLLVGVTVVGLASGEAPTPSGARWQVVDLGVVASGVVPVADMTQVKLAAEALDEPLSIVPTPADGSFDAFVVVTSAGARRFPFSSILVAGGSPVWSHQDSYAMPADRWILRLVKVADVYYADFRAGRPGGTELDPDGAAVISAEVHS